MKILVTGAAGLIGSHLCDTLLELGHEVCGIDNLSFGKVSNLYHAKKYDKFTFLELDCTKNFWNISSSCMCEASCYCDLSDFDFVYHLASAKKTFPNDTEIQLEQIKNSSWVMENNSKMIQKITEFVSRDKARLIFTSTSDVYGRHDTFNEDDEIKFDVPNKERQTYSLTKLFEEQYILNKYIEKELQVAIARVFGCFSHRSNTNGWSGGHVPLFIKRALNNDTITIHGDGRQTRSMAHVSDIVDGLISIMNNFGVCDGQIINIGSEDEMSILDHAETIIKSTNSNSKIEFIDEKKAHGTYKDIRKRKPDLRKAKLLISYKPKSKFINALSDVIEKLLR